MLVGQCIEKIRETWNFFGRMGPNTTVDTEATVNDRATFYSTLFAATGIPPKKEDYKVSELRVLFEVHLRFACVEQDSVFAALLQMCNDYEQGLTQYNETGKSRPRMKISWLRPLRVLHDADIQVFAHKCSTASGHQQWYFEDFTTKAKMRKQVYAVFNALKWVLHECKPRSYNFQGLMKLDIARLYSISAQEVRELAADAGKTFVERWKGPVCDAFKRQREHVSLIPHSIVRFMQDKLREGPPGSEEFNGVVEFHVQSDVHRGGTSHVQIMKSILDDSMDKLDESCVWMVDCRCSALDGGPLGAVDVPKILEHIMQWMSGVTRWNAVILLGPTDSATDILEVLNTLDGSDDMVIQEGTYTFSRQSVDAKKVVAYGPYKLHFRVVGGILYVMRYPKDADWRPSAAQGSDGEWPTSWIEPTKAWEPTEWNVRARCPRTVMNIRQRFAPEGWMVSLVGMSDMVPALVNHATQKVAVFEGSAESRAQLIHWMESK
jgi:hypothetical protein